VIANPMLVVIVSVLVLQNKLVVLAMRMPTDHCVTGHASLPRHVPDPLKTQSVRHAPLNFLTETQAQIPTCLALLDVILVRLAVNTANLMLAVIASLLVFQNPHVITLPTPTVAHPVPGVVCSLLNQLPVSW
jgi:hypothetical protein